MPPEVGDILKWQLCDLGRFLLADAYSPVVIRAGGIAELADVPPEVGELF